jgi:hypothetical protein
VTNIGQKQQQCKSWFKRNSEQGRIVGLWPGSSVHAQEALKNPRFEDFHYIHLPETRRNNMAWLGNGMTTAQESGDKTTTYLDTVDIPPPINHGPRPPLEVGGHKEAKNGLSSATLKDHTATAAAADHIEDLSAAMATVPL